MIERFTHEKLERFLEQHPVTEAGRAFIARALEKPSRNAQGTTQNVVADIPCPKMGGNAQAESWSNEHPFTLAHIFDERVIGYINQPPSIELRYKGRNSKTIRAPYTGDCLCFDLKRGVVVEEWKPADLRGQLEFKFPGKFKPTSAGGYCSPPIESAFGPMGIGFSVRFSDEISSIGHRNRTALFTYLQPRAKDIYLPKLEGVLSHFDYAPSKTLAELIQEGADIDALKWALAQGHLTVDFDAALITTEPSRVRVFRHFETFRAWNLAIRPDGSRPDLSRSVENFKFKPGDKLMFDGQRLMIAIVGASLLFTTNEEGEHVNISYSLLHSANLEGKVTLPGNSGTDTATSPFLRASPAALDRAILRASIVEAIGAGVPIEDEFYPRTVRRWKRLVLDGAAKGLSPVESLIGEEDQRGYHGSHIALELDAKLNSWILNALSDKLGKSTRAIYYDIKELAEADNFHMVAMSSFYERVKKLRSVKTVRNSLGHKRAYPQTPVHWMLERNTPVHCERALELVHFDSTLLDLELRSSISGEVIGRAWLSIAVCAHTRRVVGMHLSFRPPSYVSSMMLLADIVKRFGRLPEAIIHDWGSEFKAKCFKHALSALSIKRFTRPKSAPRFGSILERLFGVVTQELISNIAGNTKIRKNVREVSPQADPTTHSGLWLADLYEGLEDYFFRIYDLRKHPATLRIPCAMFDASFITHGMQPHRMRNYNDILPILMPIARGRPRIVDPARGIYVNYKYYGHPLLANLAMRGASILVKPLPFDPGSVLAFLKREWTVCRTAEHEEFKRVPEHIRRCWFEEWMREQRLVVGSKDISYQQLRILTDKLNKKALENVEYFQDREVKGLLEYCHFPSKEVETTSNSSLTKLKSMMSNALALAIESGTISQ